MGKVVTITLNPAFDTTLVLDGIHTDRINRPVSETKISAGKGINISESLSALGMDNIAAAIVGRDSLEAFRKPLDEKGIHCRFVIVDGEVRENLTLLADGNTVKINRAGNPLDKSAIERMKELIRDMWEDGDVVIFSGSIPDGIDDAAVDSLISYAGECGYRVVVDSENISAQRLMNLRPWMIKPNENELEILTGRSLCTEEEMLDECRKLTEAGIGQVLFTVGEKGLYLVTKDRIIRAVPPKTEEVNSVGAGDTSLAGFVYAFLTGKTEEECAVYAAACGCAVVASQLPYLTDMQEVTALAEKTKVY